MQEDPLQPGQADIEESLLSARNLLFRRRYREALDLVNPVVLVTPSDPRSFLVRAAAFEGMELLPQADADLDHARRLCAEQGLDFDKLVDELNQPPPKPGRKHQDPRPPRRKSSGAGFGEMAIIAGFIVFLAVAVGTGTYILIGSLDINNDDNGSPSSVSNPSPTPGEPIPATNTPDPATPAPADRTQTPAASLPAGVDGVPYSLSSVEASWEAEGMTVTGGSAATGFSGFSIAPTAVNVSGSGTSARTAVFVYEDASATSDDWTLVLGERPAPNAGNTVPPHFTIYWNTNVVIVVLDDPGALGESLLNGIINMAP